MKIAERRAYSALCRSKPFAGNHAYKYREELFLPSEGIIEQIGSRIVIDANRRMITIRAEDG